MRKAFRPFSCAATSEGTSAVGQTKDGSSSVLLRKQNVRLPFIWGKIGYFAHRKNGVDLFYFHVDVPDKNHGSQNTVLCRQLPAVLPDSITGERCGEASAEFSILLPPRRPYLCAAVALLNLLCVFTHPPFADFEKRPPFRLPDTSSYAASCNRVPIRAEAIITNHVVRSKEKGSPLHFRKENKKTSVGICSPTLVF